jgi:hypothetical protein
MKILEKREKEEKRNEFRECMEQRGANAALERKCWWQTFLSESA